MWIIIKFDKKNLNLLKQDLGNKLGKDIKFYIPKILIKKFYKNKLLNKEFHLLGDYMFCYHKSLSDVTFLKIIKNCKGLKYILKGCIEFQNEIVKFINKCKSFENDNGFLKQNFYDLDIKKYYKFTSGPFVEQMFSIIKIQQNKIDILIGNLKTSVKKQEFLFSPI